MSDEAPMLTPETEAQIRRRVEAATPGPWGWNSYSAIHSASIMQAETDDTPDYPEGKRPGPPFFTDEDNAWLAQREAAYEADPLVAWVPAHYGDTATGRHAADADFIAHTRTDIPTLLTEIDQLRERLAAAEAALPSPAKLWALAEWFDAMYPNDANPEVQSDLRGWARAICAVRGVDPAILDSETGRLGADGVQAPEPQGAEHEFGPVRHPIYGYDVPCCDRPQSAHRVPDAAPGGRG
jgi:hypothetical protein